MELSRVFWVSCVSMLLLCGATLDGGGGTDGSDTTTEPFIGLRPGDANADGSVNIADPVKILNMLFSGGDLPDCYVSGDGSLSAVGVAIMDGNGDTRVNLADALYALNSMKGGGPRHVLFAEGSCVNALRFDPDSTCLSTCTDS